MNLAEVEQLVAELLGTGEMNSDTTVDLNRMLAVARAGQSDDDDLQYLRALHARIILSTPAAQTDPEPVSAPQPEAEDPGKQLRDLRAELEAAHRTIAELQRGPASEAGDQAKFHEIKQRFARMYGPDASGASGTETMSRSDVFKEFWKEFEEVERS